MGKPRPRPRSRSTTRRSLLWSRPRRRSRLVLLPLLVRKRMTILLSPPSLSSTRTTQKLSTVLSRTSLKRTRSRSRLLRSLLPWALPTPSATSLFSPSTRTTFPALLPPSSPDHHPDHHPDHQQPHQP